MLNYLRKQKLVPVFLLWWILTASPAPAQEPHLSGYLKFFAHPNLNSPYLLDRYGTRLQLALSRSLQERADFYAAFDFNLEENNATGLAGEPRSRITEIYPVEAYLDLHWPVADLRLGKQFIFWGRTDWINPTDNITPWDFQNITAEIEDYRLPVGAVKLDAYPGNWTIEAVLVPLFKPNRVEMRFGPSLGGLPVDLQPPGLPDSRLRNWQFGLRISGYASGFDFSASYWQGYDLFPAVHMRPVTGAQGRPEAVRIQQQFHRQRVLGADFARSFGRWTVKGEAGYFRTADPAGENIFIKNPHLQYVLGLEFAAASDLTLNAQFVQDILFRYSRATELRRWQRIGIPAAHLSERVSHSLSARLQYKGGGTWSFQLISVLNLAHDDYFVLPIVKYEFTDGINLYAGAAIFGGPAGSVFGRSKRFSRAFLEVKYSF